MTKKFLFYQECGVEEYYIYDPDDIELTGLLHSRETLKAIEEINGWVSPRLGIRFELTENTLQIYRPDGQKFLTFLELETRAVEAEQRAEQEHQRAEQAQQQAEQARQRAEQAQQQAEQEHQRAEQAQQQAEQERQRAEQAEIRLRELEARLRELEQ